MANGTGDNVQTSGPSTITSPQSDTVTFDHLGNEVGDSNVDTLQNTPNTNTPVIEWTIPHKFTEVVFAGGKHITKAEFRTLETASGDGTTTTFSLSADVIAVAGERAIEDQPFAAVVAYDTDAGSELTVDSVDYMKDEVTFESAPNNGNDNVKIYPVFGGGSAQYRGYDGFGHQVGPLDEFGVPMHVFNDFDTGKNETQIHMVGSGRFVEDEVLALFVDSPTQVVWEDPDYPRGEYVSRIEQRVDAQL